MSTAGAKGKVALDNQDYEGAITHLTTALKESKSPLWLIQRATAYHRTKQYELSLADADAAVFYATGRGRREQIGTGHFRRAVAYHGLKQYGNARMCLRWAQKFNEKEKGLTMWVSKIKGDYESAGGEDAECNQITALEKIAEPIEEVSKETKSTASTASIKENKPVDKAKAVVSESVVPVKSVDKAKTVVMESVVPVKSVDITPKVPAATPKDKIRHEWYQSLTSVTLEILAKGVPKDKAEVEIQEGSLDVSFPVLASNNTFNFNLDPLFAKIDKEKSSFRVTPHKIEIILHKATPGKWATLEGTEPILSTPAPATEPIPSSVLQAEAKAPSYPSSSRTGPKNWDTLVQDDGEDDDSGPDAFFKQLYKNADPDTRRAMMKSYQESNGTSLSTNWSDVKSKSFKTEPPSGMEEKKWEI